MRRPGAANGGDRYLKGLEGGGGGGGKVFEEGGVSVSYTVHLSGAAPEKTMRWEAFGFNTKQNSFSSSVSTTRPPHRKIPGRPDSIFGSCWFLVRVAECGAICARPSCRQAIAAFAMPLLTRSTRMLPSLACGSRRAPGAPTTAPAADPAAANSAPAAEFGCPPWPGRCRASPAPFGRPARCTPARTTARHDHIAVTSHVPSPWTP